MVLVHHFLQQSAKKYPDKTALIFRNERLTYMEFECRANALGNGLIDCGVMRGDRVVIWLKNSIEACVSIFGVLKAGAAFVMINPTTKKDKLLALIEDCRPSILITDNQGSRNLGLDLHEIAPDIHVIEVGGKPDSNPQIFVYQDILKNFPHTLPPVSCIDRDLATLIYTSGSTGLPKGVMSAHYNMVAAANSICQYLQNTSDDIVLNALPLAFDYGLYQLLMTCLFGGTLVLENSFAFPVEVLKLMRKEKVTGFPVVPSMVAILLQIAPIHLELPDLCYMTNTGAALPVSHIQYLQKLLGEHVRIYSMYGQTECKRTLFLPPEELNRRPGSVGIAIPNEEVFLLDEDGSEVGPGEIGELYVRGANVMLGYWQRPIETARTFLPGPLPGERILRSFDLFRRDEDGFLYFVSRTDSIIKSRGQKVSPQEVEAAIYTCEGVVEVAILGIDHDIWGQTLHAFVVADPANDIDERTIIRHCRRLLEDFMIPERVIFVDSLPKTPSGKIDRLKLKELQLER